MSDFDITIARFDNTVRKNGHFSYRRDSVAPLSGSPCVHSSNAAPVPYHPGSMTRDWLQDSTHGMARRSEMAVVCLREAGRLPMLRAPISATGVDISKYCTNPGVSCTNSP